MHRTTAGVITAVLLTMPAPWAAAHCDGLDGPVVNAARQALAEGNVSRALIWVQPEGEAAVREAFDQALAGRKSGGGDAADHAFFETLVRVHREGEGEAYTGLKPAGRDLGPAIPAADAALQTGSADAVAQLLTDQLRRGVSERFEKVMATKNFDPNDVEAGRAHVAAYVGYVHYVEKLYEAAASAAHHEGHEAPASAASHPEHAH